jgi:hypothetical protein
MVIDAVRGTGRDLIFAKPLLNCLLVQIGPNCCFREDTHTLLQNIAKLAPPTRFERVTFAFGGQRSGAQTIS